MERLASETIFSGKDTVIPMADVAFIERDYREAYKGAIRVVMKCSKWNEETQSYEPSVWMPDGEGFLRAWCDFRGEIDPVRSGAPAVSSGEVGKDG